MSVLNHMISPSDKPSLYVTQQQRDRDLVSGDDEAQNVKSNCVFFFLRLVWRGVDSVLTSYKKTVISW